MHFRTFSLRFVFGLILIVSVVAALYHWWFAPVLIADGHSVLRMQIKIQSEKSEDPITNAKVLIHDVMKDGFKEYCTSDTSELFLQEKPIRGVTDSEGLVRLELKVPIVFRQTYFRE